jgi:hypothetical protein
MIMHKFNIGDLVVGPVDGANFYKGEIISIKEYKFLFFFKRVKYLVQSLSTGQNFWEKEKDLMSYKNGEHLLSAIYRG